MKTSLLALLCIAILGQPMLGQSGSIINTLGTGGTFSVKDGSTTFFTLSQSNGFISVNKSLSLPATFADSTLGVIYKGNQRFIHDYNPPGNDGFNTYVGVNAGNFTMSGSNPFNASCNTAVGNGSLLSNTSGYRNSAFGYLSLHVNNSGAANSAFGTGSLQSNTSAICNSAFGFKSLYSNTQGSNNSALGDHSLYLNTTGGSNCAFGSYSLYQSTTGISNSGFGHRALYNSTGSFNTAVGDSAGNNVTSGSNNTAIGHNAQVPTATADNQVRIGDTNVSYAGIQVAWTVTSDRRWKSSITSTDLGLDFIARLNPVSYSRKNDEKLRTEYGFIAQEIAEVLKQSGVRNAGMLTVDDEGRYELRYNDLLAPMVKAIQELKAENDALRSRLDALEGRLATAPNEGESKEVDGVAGSR